VLHGLGSSAMLDLRRQAKNWMFARALQHKLRCDLRVSSQCMAEVTLRMVMLIRPILAPYTNFDQDVHSSGM
jgi:hypothetical protein